MLKAIARIDWARIKHGLFVTLTYPDERVMRDRARRNTDRYLFLRYFEMYSGGQFAAVWRLEWKRRRTGIYKGQYVPHFHFLIIGVKHVHHEILRGWWRKVLDWDGPLATDVRSCGGGEMAALYVAKYAGKVEVPPSLDYVSNLNIEGRHYGFHRRHLLPMADRSVLPELTDRQISFLMRAGAERLPWLSANEVEGFTLLGDYAEQVFENLWRLGVDE